MAGVLATLLLLWQDPITKASYRRVDLGLMVSEGRVHDHNGEQRDSGLADTVFGKLRAHILRH